MPVNSSKIIKYSKIILTFLHKIAIGLLLKLKYLNVSSNNLVEISNSIGELVMLKDLNLINNKLKSVPECIKNLTCLETLKLKANYWISIPESIEKLKEQGLQIIL